MKVIDDKIALTLQKTLDRWLFFAPCPGANVTILDSAHGAWSGSTGYCDVDTLEPMPVGGQCYIYSITKTFTAVRVLQLVQQGDLSLEDPVSRYLPGIQLLEQITIQQLLNHTSGLPNYTELSEYVPSTRSKPSNPWSFDEVLDRTCRGELDFPSGESWHYSNTGYMVLHRIIERITGVRFSKSIDGGILQRLDLNQTRVATNINQGALLPGYCQQFNDLRKMENVVTKYHPGWCLTGLMISTTKDVAQFYSALFSGRLIEEPLLSEMTSPVPCQSKRERHPFFVKPGYGLGLMIDPEWGFGGLYGHGGDGPGFNTWAMYLPDFHGRQITLVAFCNASMGAHPFQLSKQLLRALE